MEEKHTIDQNIHEATQEALQAFLPPASFALPLRDGQTSTVFTRELYAEILARYAAGESFMEICASLKLPMSLVWVWTTIPGLAQLYDEARKANSRSLVDQAQQAMRTLTGAKGIDSLTCVKEGLRNCNKEETGPNGAAMPAAWDMKYAAASIDRGARLALEVATKLNPDEFSDRLQVDKRQVSAVYVVAYDAEQRIGHEPASLANPVDVMAIPAPDKAGVERAQLTQKWRKEIAKERRHKVRSAIISGY